MGSIIDNIIECKTAIESLYGQNNIPLIYNRYNSLITRFKARFPGAGEITLFSAPGRTELAGNHTDHNCGSVIAAAVNLDIIAAVARSNDGLISVSSDGFAEEFTIDISDLAPRPDERGNSAALIRGVAAKMKELGFIVGGFNAYLLSDVPCGSGLSSSAAFEVLIATIISELFNDGKIGQLEAAKAGKYAENVYFGKPCGLMDQIASAFGGLVAIDFSDQGNPGIIRINYEFDKSNHSILIVNSGGSHGDLTSEYAAIPSEMKTVAEYFGSDFCNTINMERLITNMPMLRRSTGDRAVLRAMHFIEENRRVARQVGALERNDFETFLKLVNQSGNSSWKWLQNCTLPENAKNQSLALALAITEYLIALFGGGACRVHGGGFAGTIQVILPKQFVDSYSAIVRKILGDDSIVQVKLRNQGAVSLGKV